MGVFNARNAFQQTRVMRTRSMDISKVCQHNNKGSVHCDHLFIPGRTAGVRSRATWSDRWGIYRYPKYIHFHFEHYAQGWRRGRPARGVIGTERGERDGDTTGSGRVLPRANDIVTITVTTYPSTEWWRVTACLDSVKPRGSKIHWSGGCDPAVSMLLGRYMWSATLQRTYRPRPFTLPFSPFVVATLFCAVHPTALQRCLNTTTLYSTSLCDVSACHLWSKIEEW